MMIKYDDIDLEIEHVTAFEQKAVYSPEGGKDYLYMHVRIGVKFVWNPKATSKDGNWAAFSVDALRHRLLQPRKKLRVTIGNQVMLESPLLRPNGQSYVADANNGPAPVACNVLAIHGTKTMIGYWECETWIKECPTTPSVLLSHRWAMTHDLDEDFYTTRIIEGDAIFRSDLLVAMNATPDDFRSALFHPVPINFKRISVNTTAQGDGLTIHYRIIDEEQTLNIRPAFRAITRIKGHFTRSHEMTPPNLLDFGSMFPTYYAGVFIQVWGGRSCSRGSLTTALARAAAAFGFSNINQEWPYYKFRLTVDIVDKYAELDASLRVPASYVSAVGPALFAPLQIPALNLPDDLGEVATINNIPTTNPPSDNNARGNYLAKVVAQALLGSCEAHETPLAGSIANTRGLIW